MLPRRRTSFSWLRTRPSPFLSLFYPKSAVLEVSFTFFALLRRSTPRDARAFAAFSLHQSHRTMSMSGYCGTTYQVATSSVVSSIPEGGSLACKQCGASICSLKSLVSSVSSPHRLLCALDQFLTHPLRVPQSYRGFAGKHSHS